MNMPSDIKAKLKEWTHNYNCNNSMYSADIWKDIQTHPQDELFLELGEIYLEANQDLRTDIKKLFKKPDTIWQLTLFIRRVAKMIHRNTQTDLVKIGVAIADIAATKDDFRDVLTSLAILKYGAGLAGIQITEILEEADVNYSNELRGLLQKLKNWSEESIRLSVQKFGPSDWIQNL